MKAGGIGLLAMLMAGCVSVRSLDGTRMSIRSDTFPDYVERVFRRQNQLADELAFDLQSTGLAPSRRLPLEQAETRLLADCAALNELAAAQRDGRSLGRLKSLRLARQTPACEAAAAAAEQAQTSGSGP
jgi:hypothetical protein